MKTSLVFKTLLFCIAVYFNLTTIKYFPLTIVSMIDQCAPFLVMIFAYFFLPSDPRVNLRQFFATILAVIGTTLIVQGSTATNRVGAVVVPLLMYIFLGLRPITKATNVILLRILKKIDAMTIMTWQNSSLFIIASIYLYASGSDMSILGDFTLVDWCAYTIAVISLLMTQRLKISVSKNLSAPAQQPLAYLSIIF